MVYKKKLFSVWFYGDNKLNSLASHVNYGIAINHSEVYYEMLFMESPGDTAKNTSIINFGRK
jgi:hypothetical protein